MNTGRLISIAFLVYGAAGVCYASEDLPSKKMEVAPVIDGKVSAEEWVSAATNKVKLVYIDTGTVSGEVGQYWIGYDESYIYVASRVTANDPSRIRAEEFRDNASLWGDDHFAISFDPFGIGRDMNRFAFNPNGATSMFIAGGRANKSEWEGRFESAGRVTDTGWEGEARIPWSIMTLPKSGQQDFKFLLEWYSSDLLQTLSDVVFLGDSSNVHTLTGVEVPESNRDNPIRLLPFVYAGIDENREHVLNAGLDLKTSLSGQTTFVATVNPDFRNIEGDILSLDFSNFERLAGESRPFFQEGSGYFFAGSTFASQRIDKFDIGTKFYGKLNDKTSLGVLSTTDFGKDQALVASTTYLPNSDSAISASIVTLDQPGVDNFASRIGVWQRTGNYNFSGDFQITSDYDDGSGEAFSVGTYLSTPGLTISGSYSARSPTFNPRLGFAPSTGNRGLSFNSQLNKTHPSGPVRSTYLNLFASDRERYSGGHYSEAISMNGSVALRNGFSVNMSAFASHFQANHDYLYGGSVSYPNTDRKRYWSLSHSWGAFSGDRYTSTGVAVNYRPEQRIGLRLSYQAVEHTEYRDQTVLNFSWEMDKYQSLGGRAVRSGDKWNWYASYRMSGNTGAEYFLILGDPNASSFQETLILKVTVPLSIGG